MDYYSFPARLHTAYNDISVVGSAVVSATENAMEFTSDFIPLIPLGTPATLQWVYGDSPLMDFTGEVYLSSPGFVRLVGTDPKLIEATRNVFCVNTRLPCHIATPQEAQEGRYSRCEILYLSSCSFTLHTREDFSHDQVVLLSAEVDFLTLHHLPLYIQRRAVLRRADTLLLCQRQDCSDDNFIALSAYVSRLEKRPGRL